MRRGTCFAAVAGAVLLVTSCAGEEPDTGAGAGDSAEDSASQADDELDLPAEIQDAVADYEKVAAVGDTLTLESSFGKHEITLSNPRNLDPPEEMVSDYDLLEDGEWFLSLDAE